MLQVHTIHILRRVSCFIRNKKLLVLHWNKTQASAPANALINLQQQKHQQQLSTTYIITTMSYQFELALRQYIAAFDGTNNISPTEFQSRFDNLYHKDFIFLPNDGKIMGEDGFITIKSKSPLTRDKVFEQEASKLANGTKVTLLHFRKIGLDCTDIKLRLVNGEEESIIRIVTTITSKQAVVSQEIDESRESNLFFPTKLMAAKCASAVYKWKEMGTYQTNM